MFEWDENKSVINSIKHKVTFDKAKLAFIDPKRIIFEDYKHTTAKEKRYYCLGIVDGGVMTVRFTYRENKIRIFGAGYWRDGKKAYEKENKIY